MNHIAKTRSLLAMSVVLLSGILLAACTISITAPASDRSDSAGRTRLSTSKTASFECVKSPTGQCHYALYTTRCETATGEGGKPATTCTHQVFDQFTVIQGETREVRDLPSSYRQCMKVKDMPTVPNCD
jgi:hypothetical protein